MATASSPATRSTINTFDITDVHLSAGAVDADVTFKDTAGRAIGSFRVQVRAGSGIGLRYAADGSVEGYTRNDASITVAGAFNAFASAAGGFAAKAAALEVWMQNASRALLPV